MKDFMLIQICPSFKSPRQTTQEKKVILASCGSDAGWR